MSLIVYYTSGRDSNIMPWEVFQGNKLQLLIFMCLISAIYPIFGYAKKELGCNKSLRENTSMIISLMKEYGYVIKDETSEQMKFKHKNPVVRFFRQGEDIITISAKDDNFIIVEGLRKEVVRISAAIERALQNSE